METLAKVLMSHLQRTECLQKKAKAMVATTNNPAGELNVRVDGVREMAAAIKQLLRSARAEHAVYVETSSEQVSDGRPASDAAISGPAPRPMSIAAAVRRGLLQSAEDRGRADGSGGRSGGPLRSDDMCCRPR